MIVKFIIAFRMHGTFLTIYLNTLYSSNLTLCKHLLHPPAQTVIYFIWLRRIRFVLHSLTKTLGNHWCLENTCTKLSMPVIDYFNNRKVSWKVDRIFICPVVQNNNLQNWDVQARVKSLAASLIFFFLLARCSSYAECPLVINTHKRLIIALSPHNC